MTRTLWGRRNSANVQKCLWALAELDLPVEVVRVGGQFGGFDAGYLAMNPNAYVPCWRDDAVTLFESDAILRWIARRHGADRLWRDEAEFALADQWTTWTTATLYPPIAALFMPTVRTPRAEQRLDGLAPAAAKLADTLAVLERALEGRAHLCGDAFGFGDIAPAIMARRALLLPVGAPAAGPNLTRWLAALGARPAFRAHVDMPIGTCLEEWRAIEAERG